MFRLTIWTFTAVAVATCLATPQASAAVLAHPAASTLLSTSVAPPFSIPLSACGGVPGGEVMNTAAVRKCVGAISDHGGGTLVVEPGIWLTGAFNMTSAMTLFLSKGSVLKASDDPADFPVVPPLPGYARGRELPGPRYGAFISAYNATDLTITGENGTIEGNGQRWWDIFHNKTLLHTRPRLIEPMFSQRIAIKRVTLRNSPFWTVHPYACDEVTVDELTIHSPLHSPNTDGFDPDSTTNVRLTNSYFHVGDDGVAIKSGWDDAGIHFNRPTLNVYIQNLTVISHTSAGVAIGSEMSGGVGNVTVQDAFFYQCSTGIHIKSSVGRGGYVRNVVIDHVRMHGGGVALEVNDFYGDHPGHFNKSAIPIVGDISFKNFHGDSLKQAADFEGLKSSPIFNLVLDDVSLHAEKGFKCSNVRGKATNVFPAVCDELLP